jgi:hypothetical protein
MNDTLGPQFGNKRDVAREAIELGHEDRTLLPTSCGRLRSSIESMGEARRKIDYPPG